MKVLKTKLPDVLLIQPKVFNDSRGFFKEVYSKKRYMSAGIDCGFVQDNQSRSSRYVLRGLHYQINNSQGKLVYVVRGNVFDVAVDVRVGSPTFSEFVCVELNDQNHYQLYIPPGYAHGFCVLSEYADFEYKCTEYYSPEDEGGVIWNDPNLDIPWPVEEPYLSEKDSYFPSLVDIPEEKLPKFNIYSGK